MRPPTRIALSLCALVLGACTQFPELDETIPPAAEAAPFPTLVPLEPLLADNAAIVTAPEATTRALEIRVDALRARARALQSRPVIDAATRARLRGALRPTSG